MIGDSLLSSFNLCSDFVIAFLIWSFKSTGESRTMPIPDQSDDNPSPCKWCRHLYTGCILVAMSILPIILSFAYIYCSQAGIVRNIKDTRTQILVLYMLVYKIANPPNYAQNSFQLYGTVVHDSRAASLLSYSCSH